MLGLPARVLSLPSALRGASRPSQRALGTSGVWGCQEGGATAAGRGTLCSSGAPRASPPGPPRRTANQNHSARMGTRRAPSCSQRPPGDLTRCQALLAAAQGGGGQSGLLTPPTPGQPPPHATPRAIGSLQLNGASTRCCPAAYIRAVALNKARHPSLLGVP